MRRAAPGLSLALVTREEDPYPEGDVWRLGPPAAATVLLGVVVVSMFAIPPGLAQTLTIVLAVALDVGLMIWRRLLFKRAARPLDGPMRWHQFVFFWGATAGLGFVISSDRSRDAGLTQLGSWFVCALVVVGVLWLYERAEPPRWLPKRRARPRDDTAVVAERPTRSASDGS